VGRIGNTINYLDSAMRSCYPNRRVPPLRGYTHSRKRSLGSTVDRVVDVAPHRADPQAPQDLDCRIWSRRIRRHTLIRGIRGIAHDVLTRPGAKGSEQGSDIPISEVAATSRLSQGRVKNCDLVWPPQAKLAASRFIMSRIAAKNRSKAGSPESPMHLSRCRAKKCRPDRSGCR
jgi:hypothetical protein